MGWSNGISMRFEWDLNGFDPCLWTFLFIHFFIHVSSLQFLRLQLCVSRGDELVSENLRLRTESSELEEAEDDGNSGGYGVKGSWLIWPFCGYLSLGTENFNHHISSNGKHVRFEAGLILWKLGINGITLKWLQYNIVTSWGNPGESKFGCDMMWLKNREKGVCFTT